MAWCGFGQNNVTEDFGAEINKEFMFMLSSRSGTLTPVAHTFRSSA